MRLAQDAVTPVGLEPAAARSRVKHSTTEPLGSLRHYVEIVILNILNVFMYDKCHHFMIMLIFL